MSTEQRLIDALVIQAKENGVADWQLTQAIMRLDTLNRIENQRDEFKAEVEKRRAEHREAEPKLRELYRAADQVLVEYRRQSNRNAPALVEAEGALRKALHDTFDYCDGIPF